MVFHVSHIIFFSSLKKVLTKFNSNYVDVSCLFKYLTYERNYMHTATKKKRTEGIFFRQHSVEMCCIACVCANMLDELWCCLLNEFYDGEKIVCTSVCVKLTSLIECSLNSARLLLYFALNSARLWMLFDGRKKYDFVNFTSLANKDNRLSLPMTMISCMREALPLSLIWVRLTFK